jgi:hypothetical protein
MNTAKVNSNPVAQVGQMAQQTVQAQAKAAAETAKGGTATRGGPPGTITHTEPGIRTAPLNPALEKALSEAGKAVGVSVDVFSRGQTANHAPSTKGKTWTGSHRHDDKGQGGNAADLTLHDENGKVISRSDPRYQAFLEEAAARGAGGIGVGYMNYDPNAAHIGITGKEAIVGKGLGLYKGNAAERAAVERGLARYYGSAPTNVATAPPSVPPPQ